MTTITTREGTGMSIVVVNTILCDDDDLWSTVRHQAGPARVYWPVTRDLSIVHWAVVPVQSCVENLMWEASDDWSWVRY
jgi:hypothetical protein